MNTITFKTSKVDSLLILKIAQRAVKQFGGDITETAMDITACHANGCPLSLGRLLAADDFNFSHDIHGIANHLDRDTGKLTRHFLPRFMKPEIATGSEVVK